MRCRKGHIKLRVLNCPGTAGNEICCRWQTAKKQDGNLRKHDNDNAASVAEHGEGATSIVWAIASFSLVFFRSHPSKVVAQARHKTIYLHIEICCALPRISCLLRLADLNQRRKGKGSDHYIAVLCIYGIR